MSYQQGEIQIYIILILFMTRFAFVLLTAEISVVEAVATCVIMYMLLMCPCVGE